MVNVQASEMSEQNISCTALIELTAKSSLASKAVRAKERRPTISWSLQVKKHFLVVDGSSPSVEVYQQFLSARALAMVVVTKGAVACIGSNQPPPTRMGTERNTEGHYSLPPCAAHNNQKHDAHVIW